MSAKNEHGLTPQQEAFAQAIGSGMSGVDAYLKAYPKSAKWKNESRRVEAAKMLALPNISQRVSKIQAIGAQNAGLDAAKLLEEVRRLAHSDIAGIMTADGKVKLPHELDPATRAAIASFKIDEYGRIEYKFWDKNAAVEKAMKHLGLYEKDNAQQPTVVTEIRLVGPKTNPKKGT